jgi:hypothetical protein
MIPTRIILAGLLLLAGAVCADQQVDRIHDLVKQGKISEADRAFQQLPQSAARDGNRLFVNALLERSGDRARDLLDAAVRSDLDGKYEEEAHFRMLQLAEASNDTATVLSMGEAFLHRWEMSRYREPILAMLAAHEPNGSSQQERYLRLLSEGSPDSYYGRFAVLTKTAAAIRAEKYRTAENLCHTIIDSGDDDIVPAGLIYLAKISIARGNTERALLNYNILREKYPNAVGQEDVLQELKQVSDRRSGEESTEIFEGVVYAVQVGVFAEKDNAKRMADRVKGYGYKARITRRSISGNAYYIVLAGRFSTQKEAQVAKEKLELGEHDVFKVVIDDEK